MVRDFIIVKIGEEQEFIAKALSFDYKKLVLCYEKSESTKFNIKIKEKLIESSDLKLFFAQIIDGKRNSGKNSLFDYQIVLGTSLETVSGNIDFIYNNEFSGEKDAIHTRRSGLNHVVLAKFKEKNIGVLLSHTSLRSLKVNELAKVMGRVRQNIKASRRAKVNYEIVSMARKTTDVRDSKDVLALQKMLNTSL